LEIAVPGILPGISRVLNGKGNAAAFSRARNDLFSGIKWSIQAEESPAMGVA
jgi:hypothetical protein